MLSVPSSLWIFAVCSSGIAPLPRDALRVTVVPLPSSSVKVVLGSGPPVPGIPELPERFYDEPRQLRHIGELSHSEWAWDGHTRWKCSPS